MEQHHIATVKKINKENPWFVRPRGGEVSDRTIPLNLCWLRRPKIAADEKARNLQMMNIDDEPIPMPGMNLGASGLRALRYAPEVEGIRKVVALDSEKASIDVLSTNPNTV